MSREFSASGGGNAQEAGITVTKICACGDQKVTHHFGFPEQIIRVTDMDQITSGNQSMQLCDWHYGRL